MIVVGGCFNAESEGKRKFNSAWRAPISSTAPTDGKDGQKEGFFSGREKGGAVEGGWARGKGYGILNIGTDQSFDGRWVRYGLGSLSRTGEAPGTADEDTVRGRGP